MVQTTAKSITYHVNSHRDEQYILIVQSRNLAGSEITISSYGHTVWEGSTSDILGAYYPTHLRGILCQHEVFDEIISANEAVPEQKHGTMVVDIPNPIVGDIPLPGDGMPCTLTEKIIPPEANTFLNVLDNTAEDLLRYNDMGDEELFELAQADGLIEDTDQLEDWKREHIIELLMKQ